MIQPLGERKLSFGLLSGGDDTDNRVYYIENGKSKKLTKYVLSHYDELAIKFRQRGLVFIYVDELMLAQTAPSQLKKTLNRFFPNLDINGQDFKNLFEACKIEVDELQGLSGHLKEIPSFISNQTDRAYQVEMDNADFFSDIFDELAVTYGNDYENLDLSGLQKALLVYMKKPIPSTIRMNPKLNASLYLEDFNKELHFQAQGMALYELILSKPNGIRVDELPAERDLLMKFYLAASPKEIDVSKTIDNIINSKSTRSTLISRINREVHKVLIGPRLYHFYEVHKYSLRDNKDLLYIELPEEFRMDFINIIR